MVFPVPGAPVKTRWWLTAPTASPALRRHSLTWISSISARTSALTPARPIIESSSASSVSTFSASCVVAPSTALDADPRPVAGSSAASAMVGRGALVEVDAGRRGVLDPAALDRPAQPRPNMMPTPCVSCTQQSVIVGALWCATEMPASPVREISQRSIVGRPAW